MPPHEKGDDDGDAFAEFLFQAVRDIERRRHFFKEIRLFARKAPFRERSWGNLLRLKNALFRLGGLSEPKGAFFLLINSPDIL